MLRTLNGDLLDNNFFGYPKRQFVGVFWWVGIDLGCKSQSFIVPSKEDEINWSENLPCSVDMNLPNEVI